LGLLCRGAGVNIVGRALRRTSTKHEKKISRVTIGDNLVLKTDKSKRKQLAFGGNKTWLVMSATCRRHVADMEKCRLFLSRQGKIGDMFSCVSAHFCVAISRHVRTKDRQHMYVDRYTHYRIPVWTPLSQNGPNAHEISFSHPKTHTTTTVNYDTKHNIIAAFYSINKAPVTGI
jgi:hypothetical protein